ncbi:MAG: MATE family efflux transporter [Solobacterium sp.]|nr:MATE family efflux transporter [Solobacterium sp.]
MYGNTSKDTAKELLLFSIPMILSAVFQQMFNWADALIVGNFAGEEALAAIGATTSCYNIILDLILGASAGITILAARYYGAGEHSRIRQLFATFVRFLPAGALLVVAAGIACTPSLLQLLHTPEEILVDSVLYLRWMYAGLLFLAVYNTLAAILRGMSDSRAPFRSVVAAGAANIALDFLFVAGLHMGVGGAALATFLTQGVMTGYLLVYAARHAPFLTEGVLQEKADLHMFREGMYYALPLMLQGAAASVGKVILTGFRNGFGISVIAAITTAYRVDTVLISPVHNLGAAVAAKVSQKLGAGEQTKAKEVLRAGLWMGIGFAAVMTGFVILAGGTLIGIFGVSAQVRRIGASFFRYLGQFYIMCAVMEVLHGCLQGYGDVRFAAGNMLYQLAVRIVLSYALRPVFGWKVIAYAEGLSWCAAALSAWLRSRRKTMVS